MRLRSDEDGFTVVELTVAVVLLSVALLALMASFSSSFLATHNSARNTAASLVAETQLELYGTLSYTQIGLDASTHSSTVAGDSVYAADEADVVGTNTDHTITGCGASANCLPVQTVTGSDGKSYRLETFVYDVTSPTDASWSERTITVIVRDPGQSGAPIVVQETTAVDPGPAGPS